MCAAQVLWTAARQRGRDIIVSRCTHQAQNAVVANSWLTYSMFSRENKFSPVSGQGAARKASLGNLLGEENTSNLSDTVIQRCQSTGSLPDSRAREFANPFVPVHNGFSGEGGWGLMAAASCAAEAVPPMDMRRARGLLTAAGPMGAASRATERHRTRACEGEAHHVGGQEASRSW